MTVYLVKRVLQGALFMLVASLLVYTVLVMFMPDGPNYNYTRLKAAQTAPGGTPAVDNPSSYGQPTPADVINDLEKTYKLDKPWPLNFAAWLFDPNATTSQAYDAYNNPIVVPRGIDLDIFGLRLRGSGMLTGDFGVSSEYATEVPISELIAHRWLSSFLLLMTALLLSILIGIPVGIISASRQGSALDHAFTVLSFIGLSFPPYVLGLLLIIFLAVVPAGIHADSGISWVPWLPSGGAGEESLPHRISHLVLPALTLALPQVAWISRQARLAMLDVLRQDYIRTALAKGASARRAIWKHALRNALLPVITHAGLIMTALVSGATIVENVFGYEGLGKTFFASLGGCLWADVNRTTEPPPCPRIGYFPMDYELALTLLLIIILVVSLSTLVADFLYAVADPRITYDERSA